MMKPDEATVEAILHLATVIEKAFQAEVYPAMMSTADVILTHRQNVVEEMRHLADSINRLNETLESYKYSFKGLK